MQAPESPPPPIDDPSQSGDSVRWSAVGIGVALDWVATMVVTLIVVTTAALIANSRSKSPDAAEQYLEQLQSAPDFMISFMLAGLLCVSFGAFIAARRAGYAEVRHGALVGVGSILLSLLMENLQAGEANAEAFTPQWLRVLGYLLVIPFGLLGGVLAERTRGEPDDAGG